VFYFFVNGEHFRVSAMAFRDEAGSLGRALLRQVDEMLPHIRMPIQVVEDVGAATLRLGPGLQLLVEIGMPLQVLVDGLTHSLIALRRRVGCTRQGQRDHRRGGSSKQPPGH
jgi:hypothetical protein